MGLGESCVSASPISSHQPQGRSPGTQIPMKPNFCGFPQFIFSPARSVAGNKRKILMSYSQGQSLDSPFLQNRTILTYTNPSGSSTPGGNVFARHCIKPSSVSLLAKGSMSITRQLCLALSLLSLPVLARASAGDGSLPQSEHPPKGEISPMPSSVCIFCTCLAKLEKCITREPAKLRRKFKGVRPESSCSHWSFILFVQIRAAVLRLGRNGAPSVLRCSIGKLEGLL